VQEEHGRAGRERGGEGGADNERLIEEAPHQEVIPELERELEEQKEKYLRLYAEFENFRKRTVKEKEELIKAGNEELLREILPSLDNLETALKHATEATGGLVQGVEMTLREFRRTLEKFGLKPIEAKDKPFDPEYHHAITQVERADVPDKTVVEDLRKGYFYNDRVLRASLVAVSKKPEEEKKTMDDKEPDKEDS
jgi:molecular chaperone GrpE